MLAAVAALLLLLVGAYFLWERPPAIQEPEPSPTPTPTPEATPEASPTPEPMPEGEAFDTTRQDGIYTILLVGLDQVSMSTDTIVVGRLDTNKHEMNFVSIPRDTIINADIEMRKINAVYAGGERFGGNGIESLMNQVRRLTGFTPDCYALINLSTFVDVIDAIGGVDFDVPIEMGYSFEDLVPGLYIYLAPGYQHLDGYEAMCVVRYRFGYTTGDLGRIETQHAFLKACASQFISLGNIPHAKQVVNILAENLQTDLSAANIAWFLRQALQCRSDDIHFYMLPSEPRNLQGYSYAVPHIQEWLDLLNSALNPYDREIVASDLNMVYCSGSGYAATTMLDGAWYDYDFESEDFWKQFMFG